MLSRPLIIATVLGLQTLTICAWGDESGDEFFETRIRPLLVAQCYECHSEDSAESGLRVDSRAALLTGGERGPAIVPGKPDESLLISAVRLAPVDAK